MIIVNFAHPLTSTQLATLEQLSKMTIKRVIAVKAHFDDSRSFKEQASSLLDAVDLTPDEWQTENLIINLPSFSIIGALVLAELHGRMGYFPAVIRLRPIVSSVPLQFEVTEILNLQAVRDQAREKR